MRILLFLILGNLAALGIPNAIIGPIVEADSPLNDQDLTDPLLASALWEGETELPGRWQEEAPIAGNRSAHLLARPKVFGLPAVMVQATHRDDRLQSLAITFADAGSYFGYSNARNADNDDPGKAREALVARQAAFATAFADTRTTLLAALEAISNGRPRENPLGKTRTLRAEVTDFRHGDLVLRFLEGENRLLRVLILPEKDLARTWLDPRQAARSADERLDELQANLTRTAEGDVFIRDLPVVPQGYRPYCGLNTLAMAARYFGLHLDEDWLAVAGQFQNTGTAAGSQMPRLYQAVAKEAELDMIRLNRFDPIEARRSLQQGLPVIVWRRFSSERDRIHSANTRMHAKDPAFATPAPTEKDREAYPDDEAPLHASVVVGYNDKTREFLFMESWSAAKSPRRMRAEELEATAYLTFCFRP